MLLRPSIVSEIQTMNILKEFFKELPFIINKYESSKFKIDFFDILFASDQFLLIKNEINKYNQIVEIDSSDSILNSKSTEY